VTKPFSTRELIARIRSAVRRVRAPARPEDAPIEIGEIRLEPAKRLVTKRGAPVRHAQGIRHSVLPDEPRRARSDLRQAVDRGVGRGEPRRS